MAAVSLPLLLLLTSSFLLFSFTLTVSISADNENSTDVQLIRDVCKKTTDPDFCFALLSTNPNSKGKDFHDLTALSINSANERGVAVRAYIGYLGNNTGEPVMKGILEECYGDYDDGVVKGTAGALDAFAESEYGSAVLRLSGSVSATLDCDKAFESGSRENVLKDLNGTVMRYLIVAGDLINAFRKNK
ncbi:hypothetical protein H6P81_017662 [Aristolochia fimbriata]|uniref:Pectinesterase inhibitor domain-containing protein n=1 Tax=Aristolochia fimbriata TaxID=158543 RepID=A0AAV7DZJ4_ARIFI|nr:hypothetical protein H6P81_017662 [Aristolochia fimbriata]